MKIEQNKKAFDPIVITIESEEEARVFKKMVQNVQHANTNREAYDMSCTLWHSLHRAGIKDLDDE